MPVTVEQFLESLGSSGILSKEDCAKVEQAWPPERRAGDAKPLAADLVRQKLLTQFQALNLYHGKAQFLVLGNYVLVDVLGEGGMGKVYKAVHRRMKRTVAVKLLPAALTKQTEALRRFQREVQAAAQLVHPNIVTAYDADEARDVHFLVMEYVEGKDLGSYLKENGVLSVALAVDCIMQAARGLEYAHAQGVIHRDIKPSNLILGPSGVVKVMDMGLACFEPSQQLAASSSDGDKPGEHRPSEKSPASCDPRRERTELTRQGQVIGTVGFMAPEQTLEMGLADARSDIYALGCTLYRLLTGDVPYHRDTIEATMAAHREAPIPSLRRFRRDVTPELDAVLRKMLAKQPSERYQSMGDVIAALRELTCDSGPAQHVSQKAAGDDFQSDLLGSLMGLGPGGAGALLNTPGDQNWSPADHARARAAAGQAPAVSPQPAPAFQAPAPAAPPPPRAFPWTLVAVAGTLALVAVTVFIVLRTEPPQTETVLSKSGPEQTQGEPAPKKVVTQPEPKKTQIEPPPPKALTRPPTPTSPTEVFALSGHTAGSISLALAADAGLLLSGGKDGKLMLWDLRARRRIKEIDGRAAGVRSVAISKDGRRGVSGGYKSGVYYWDLENGKVLHEFDAHADWVGGVALSPGGSLVASVGFDADLRIYNAQTYEKMQDLQCQQLASTWARGVAFSPDGQRVATCGNDAHAAVWNVDTGERIHRVGPHKQPVGKIRFAPKGNLVVTGGFDNRILLWNLDTGISQEFIGHSGNITGVVFTPDGRHLLSSSSDGSAQMWDASSGRAEHRFAQGGGAVGDMVCTTDGRYAITSAEDNQLRVWRLPLEVPDDVPDFLTP